MKKLFSFLALAIGAFVLTSCEDIPAPYQIWSEGNDDNVNAPISYTSASLYTDWSTQAVGENNPWSQGSSYTQATGYQKWDGADTKSNRQAEGFLISPQFNTVSTTGAVKFSFDYCMAYINNDKDWKNHVRIYVSTNFDDTTINLDAWELIDWAPTFSSTDWSLASTGDIALPEAYVNQKNVRIAIWFFAPEKGSSTFEIKNFSIQDGPCVIEGESGSITGGDDTVVGKGEGKGTVSEPYNVAAAIAYTSALSADTESPVIYIKGKVARIQEISTDFGNGTFYISDDGKDANTFCVWRCLDLGNKKFTSSDAVKVGDEVIICGPVVNFKGNTPETVQNKAYLYAINGNTSGDDGGGTPVGDAKGDGSLANPFNPVGANAFAAKLASGAESASVYVKGKVAKVKEVSAEHGNATFYISEDGKDANTFYVFRCLDLGNKKITSSDAVKVGDEVIIYGPLTNYMGNTPETVQNKCYIYSLNGKTAGTGSDTGDSTGGDDSGTGRGHDGKRARRL